MMRFLFILVAFATGGMFLFIYIPQLSQNQITVGGRRYGTRKTLTGNSAWLIGIPLVLSGLAILVSGVMALLDVDSFSFFYFFAGGFGGNALFNMIGVFFPTGGGSRKRPKGSIPRIDSHKINQITDRAKIQEALRGINLSLFGAKSIEDVDYIEMTNNDEIVKVHLK